MTDAIYRVWYGAFDQAAALQLATVLVGLTVSLLALERLLRGRARYHGALVRGEAVTPRRLHGARRQRWPRRSRASWWGSSSSFRWSSSWCGPRLAGRRRRAPRAGPRRAQLAAAGDGRRHRRGGGRRPVAAARRARPDASLLLPPAPHRSATPSPARWWPSRSMCRWPGSTAGSAHCLLGDGPGLILAYVVRFHALALSAVRSRLARIDSSLDEAARALGADRGRVLAEVQLLLLYPGLVTATLLVFVEVLKELPATARCARWVATRWPSRCGKRRRTRASMPPRCLRCSSCWSASSRSSRLCAPPGADSTRATPP